MLGNVRFTVPALAALLFLAACDQQQDQAAAPPPSPPEVTAATPLKKQVVEWDEYTGRFQAVQRVEIRPRVSGYLEQVLFEDGQIVEAGQTLYIIDQRPFKIALSRAQAQVEFAQKEFNRFERLAETSAASRQRLDEAAEALRLARADLAEAQLNMEFTEVKAPIGGRISETAVDAGNLVNGDLANSTPLTTIVSLDPIHFYFEASEQQFLKYVRLNLSGARPASRETPNPIYIKLQDENTFGHIGAMDFVDNEIDESTGTILGRAILDNTNGDLSPGVFGRARLLGSGIYEALLIPDTAIGTDQSRKFVMLVNGENRAERRFVELGPIRDSGLRIIRSGLSETDRVIINGLQRARPGSPVTPVDGTIEEPNAEPLPDILGTRNAPATPSAG